jgi:hypothetical protein
MVENATTMRDALLIVASRATRTAEAQGIDPAVLPHVLVDAWRDAYPDVEFAADGDSPAPERVSVDVGFVPDQATGVESLTFLVRDVTGSHAAGILLRLPSEYPDSFEPVAANGRGPCNHHGARTQFFLAELRTRPYERPGEGP